MQVNEGLKSKFSNSPSRNFCLKTLNNVTYINVFAAEGGLNLRKKKNSIRIFTLFLENLMSLTGLAQE